MDTILQVKKLTVSFRTPGGTLKAVRDISFDLERGKTLAIVGESGSGKSVTSKAILGILAGNSILESGEILYDGKDLLQMSEADMCRIRGDKISMIFQDPLSALNPIVKIGKQITEAMLLKNKGNRRAARKQFNALLAKLKECMIASGKPADETERLTKTFDNFNIVGIKLENSYNEARGHAEAYLSDMDNLLFMLEHKQNVDVRARVLALCTKLTQIRDEFLLAGHGDELNGLARQLKAAARVRGNEAHDKDGSHELPAAIREPLDAIACLLKQLLAGERPNFFRIGYWYMKKPGEPLTGIPVAEANRRALELLDSDFMNRFIEYEKSGLAYSIRAAREGKQAVVNRMETAKSFFAADFDKAGAKKLCHELAELVEKSIDPLATVKDSIAYTFASSLNSAIDKYFFYQTNNVREEARFAKQTAKRDALIARGKQVDWKVVPKSVCDPEVLRQNILDILNRLESRYREYLAGGEEDLQVRAIALIDSMKDMASAVVYKVTKAMARAKAIQLMEEVGIPEPQVRYNQYPFEFSGGMRQRIVIAIALAANPDILICDEPTTALDVTIQAQILELINNLKRERNLSVIFITHDLGVVANMADDIAVMYAGKIVEYGTADDIFYDPRHPYTWALLSSMPDLDTNEKLDAIPGTPPNMIFPPVGDAFAARNKYAMKIDFEKQPPMFEVSPTHRAATWLLHPDAPKVEIPKIITDRIERMRKALAESEGGAHEQS